MKLCNDRCTSIYLWMRPCKKKNPGFTILKWKKKRKGYHVFTINIPWARNSENCFNSVQRSKLPNVYATWNQTNVTVIYQRRQIACYRLFMRVFVTLKARAFHELKEVQSFLGGNTKFYALTQTIRYIRIRAIISNKFLTNTIRAYINSSSFPMIL